jgi:succinate-semialdehyde dehydrogenase / glutarate-semialdehyde dehydrogenase
VLNPATGEELRHYQEMEPAAIAGAITAVDKAFHEWRRLSFSQRAALMREAAEILRARAGEYAVLMAEEMGKPVRDGRAEAEKCAWVCDYYADNAAAFLAREDVPTDASSSFVTFQPLGVILAVMPWNFPFWQVFRFAAPALMAGNAAILKHASNVPGCALAIEEIFGNAGFPDHLFRSLLVGSSQVSAIIENPLVRAVTLTGSTPAGRAVAAKAGEMIKKTVLELGGSDPYIILDDADLDLAVTTCAYSRLINSGQSCIAAKRFIVTEKNRAEFERRFVAHMASFRVGNPLDEETQVGPQARHDLRDELHRQVEESIAAGARLLLGGEFPMERALTIRRPS